MFALRPDLYSQANKKKRKSFAHLKNGIINKPYVNKIVECSIKKGRRNRDHQQQMI